MRFLPREEKFFHLFGEQSRIICDSAALLLESARRGNSFLKEAAIKIDVLEQKGDEILHEVFRRLNQTFITPLDPEDIHKLASTLDDVLDGIEDAAHRLMAYHLEPIPPAVVGLCEIIHACAQSLHKAVEALGKDRQVLEFCIEVNALEDKADQLLRRAIEELFERETDPIRIMKVKEVCEFLETTTDRCEDVSDVLQNVVVKNN